VVRVDSRLERFVLAEFAIWERSLRRRDRSSRARILAEKLHRGQEDPLAHLSRVALAVPSQVRAVAWLHHASQATVTPQELKAAGLTTSELQAIELLAPIASLGGTQPCWIGCGRYPGCQDGPASWLEWSRARRSATGPMERRREARR
jgi:hypothetical protein